MGLRQTEDVNEREREIVGRSEDAPAEYVQCTVQSIERRDMKCQIHFPKIRNAHHVTKFKDSLY